MEQELKKLVSVIEEKLGWGNSDSWKTRDFEHLSQLILKEAGTMLSVRIQNPRWNPCP